MEGHDLAVLDEDVVEGDHDLSVDRWPVVLLGWVNHQVAVEAHVQPVVLADMRVVPVQTGVRKAQPVGELAAGRDRRLGLVRHAVVLVVQAQPVPVHSRLDIGVVSHTDADLGPLGDPERRPRYGAVVGEHAHLVIAELLDDRRDTQVVGLAIPELH